MLRACSVAVRLTAAVKQHRSGRPTRRAEPGYASEQTEPSKRINVPALETDLQAERDHLAASRRALKRMREHAEDLFATGDKVAGDAYAAETLGRHLHRRITELADNPDTPLFFGRLDIDDDQFHIGRRHVTDPTGEPMVLDWRAPISRKFYQASVKDPQDVTTRRRFGFVKGELTSFEDEHLQRDEEIGTSRILLEEIERPRVTRS